MHRLDSALTNDRLSAAGRDMDRWYLFRRDGRDVGYFHVAAADVSRQHRKGIEVRTYARLDLRGGFLSPVFFATTAHLATAIRDNASDARPQHRTCSCPAFG